MKVGGLTHSPREEPVPNLNVSKNNPSVTTVLLKDRFTTTPTVNTVTTLDQLVSRVRSTTNTPGFRNWKLKKGRTLPMRAFSYSEKNSHPFSGTTESVNPRPYGSTKQIHRRFGEEVVVVTSVRLHRPLGSTRKRTYSRPPKSLPVIRQLRRSYLLS